MKKAKRCKICNKALRSENKLELCSAHRLDYFAWLRYKKAKYFKKKYDSEKIQRREKS